MWPSHHDDDDDGDNDNYNKEKEDEKNQKKKGDENYNAVFATTREQCSVDVWTQLFKGFYMKKISGPDYTRM
jgi:hypothetical protein